MDFKRELKERTENIEKILAVFAPEEQGFQKTIFQAMNYSLMAGGKRLRPLLIQETYRLFGGSHEAVIHPFMAAIEMIHTYSLIHDDLPALDNDEYRRGRKTSHVVFGEAMAILAGDALLNYAYEIAAGAFDLAENDVEFRRVARALQVLTAKPGIYGMIGGQVVDVEKEGEGLEKPVLDFERLKKIEEACGIPLVMHGTTGVDHVQIKRAIVEGVRKFNYFTGVATAAALPVEEKIKNTKGTIYYHEIAECAKEAMKIQAKNMLTLLRNT